MILKVRVEVLGVLDRATGLVRLRATEPSVGATQIERFSKIFEPMPIWVQRNTKIITVSTNSIVFISFAVIEYLKMLKQNIYLNDVCNEPTVNFRTFRWTRNVCTSSATHPSSSAASSPSELTSQTRKSWNTSRGSCQKCFRYLKMTIWSESLRLCKQVQTNLLINRSLLSVLVNDQKIFKIKSENSWFLK